MYPQINPQQTLLRISDSVLLITSHYMTENTKQFKRLIIKSRAVVFIDWANVHGWKKKLGWGVNAYKLIAYFKTYIEISKINFYFGTDVTQESKNFINSIQQLEDDVFKVITKQVKYISDIFIPYDENYYTKGRRKCDFDVEITRDALNNANSFETFVLVSGDGDYAPLIDDMISKGKKTILIFAPGCRGKEYGDLKRGFFLCSVNKIREYVGK